MSGPQPKAPREWLDSLRAGSEVTLVDLRHNERWVTFVSSRRRSYISISGVEFSPATGRELGGGDARRFIRPVTNEDRAMEAGIAAYRRVRRAVEDLPGLLPRGYRTSIPVADAEDIQEALADIAQRIIDKTKEPS